MTDVRFDPIEEEDLDEVQAVYNHYVLHGTATFHTHPLKRQEMRAIVVSGDARFPSYLIRCGDETAGYCMLAPFKKREAYDATAELTVYLKPQYTGKGLGKTAVRMLEEKATQLHMHALLAVICGENTQSIRLFECCGYEKCAHYREIGHKFGRYLDVVVMQKILPSP